MYDRMYCLTCKQTFPDTRETRKAQKEITFGQFLYNQQRVMWDEPIAFTGNNRTFQVNCPHCNSIKTINMQAVICGEITVYSRRVTNGDDKQALQKLGRKMKRNGELIGYKVWKLKKGYALYEFVYLREKFKRMLKKSRKTKPLNTKNDII